MTMPTTSTIRTLTTTACAGTDRFTFSGRMGGRALKPGRYRLLASESRKPDEASRRALLERPQPLAPARDVCLEPVGELVAGTPRQKTPPPPKPGFPYETSRDPDKASTPSVLYEQSVPAAGIVRAG